MSLYDYLKKLFIFFGYFTLTTKGTDKLLTKVAPFPLISPQNHNFST